MRATSTSAFNYVYTAPAILIAVY